MYLSLLTLLGALSLSSHINSIHAYNTNTPTIEQAASIVAVKNVVSLKYLVIANHEFSILPQIFTEDVVLLAPDWDINIKGLANVTKYLQEADGESLMILENSSQYAELISTTVAKVLSNTQETSFGVGAKQGKATAYWERFEEFLRKETKGWRIYKTTIKMVGGPIGDSDVLGLSASSKQAMGDNRRFKQQL
ncbi:MAG: hypothetical protein M1812_006805 [Candelaria pacifica]|nr:MAG: hypothetical protein M1812_006805 [Candelaria pacifica]